MGGQSPRATSRPFARRCTTGSADGRMAAIRSQDEHLLRGARPLPHGILHRRGAAGCSWSMMQQAAAAAGMLAWVNSGFSIDENVRIALCRATPVQSPARTARYGSPERNLWRGSGRSFGWSAQRSAAPPSVSPGPRRACDRPRRRGRLLRHGPVRPRKRQHGHGSGGAGEMTAGRVHAMPTARRGFVSTSRSIAASSRPRCWRRFSRICGIVTVEPARFRAPGRRATPAASTSTSPSPYP